MAIDILCLQEVNTNWSATPLTDRLDETTAGWFRSTKTVCAWNKKTGGSERFHYGGTAIILRNEAADRYIKSGVDPSGLGRWCWVLLRGYGGKSILVVSAYRPCYNIDGPDSVWNQHKTHFDSLSPPRNVDPRDAFITDLVAGLKRFHIEGAQIVLCIDTNFQQLRDVDNSFEAKLRDLKLHDIVLKQNTRANAPPTSGTGSNPIDSILTGSTLHSCQCGYLSSPYFSDHKGLFLDINKTTAFGAASLQNFAPPSIRKLNSNDPRVVKKYNKDLKKLYKGENLPRRAFQLDASANLAPRKTSETEATTLDKLRAVFKLKSENTCRHVFSGKVAFSEEYLKALVIHRFWDLQIKRSKGRKIGLRYLRKVAKIAGTLEHIHAPLLYGIEQREKAWYELKVVKSKAPAKRKTFLEKLAVEREKAGFEKAATGLRSMKHREKQRKNSRILKNIFKNTARGGLSTIEVPDEGNWENGEWQGTWKAESSKEGLEKGSLEENDRRFRQAGDTFFLQPQVLDIVGPLGLSAEAENLQFQGIKGNLASFTDHITDAYLDELAIPYAVKKHRVFPWISLPQGTLEAGAE